MIREWVERAWKETHRTVAIWRCYKLACRVVRKTRQVTCVMG